MYVCVCVCMCVCLFACVCVCVSALAIVLVHVLLYPGIFFPSAFINLICDHFETAFKVFKQIKSKHQFKNEKTLLIHPYAVCVYCIINVYKIVHCMHGNG